MDFELLRGEVHAIVGENGAGKSTLINILSGAIPPTEGEIYLDGERIQHFSPSYALKHGISVIHQELLLIPELDVGQNIFLGQEPIKGGFIDWPVIYKKSKEILSELGLSIDPYEKIKNLSIAMQQMVEIARAISFDAKVIAMDEPTSSLSEEEINILFDLIKRLSKSGKSIIYISHRLEEIFEIANRVTVMKDGEKIITDNIENLTKEKIVTYMVGRKIEEMYPERKVEKKEEILSVGHFTRAGYFEDISFSLHRGEILGFYGLVGAGRSELAQTIFGLYPKDKGVLRFKGKKVKIKRCQDAISLGIGYLPEDRKTQGLFLNMAITHNTVISSIYQFLKMGILLKNKIVEKTKEYIELLKIKTPSVYQIVNNLSGGNQQKVIIAKWLLTRPEVFILDEPTRGIDVGTKREIYNLMDSMSKEGIGIVMISSDLPEILGVADRIIVMREGKIVGEFTKDEATEELVVARATGAS